MHFFWGGGVVQQYKMAIYDASLISLKPGYPVVEYNTSGKIFYIPFFVLFLICRIWVL